jgi:branched-chain amino acid transport system substrate-binding protein
MAIRRRLLVVGILGLACLLLAQGCSRGPIKLLVAAPFSGGQAKGGQDVWNGVELAVEEWNAKGGVNGRKIVLVKADDKGDADTALSVAKEYSGKVDAVIGHYNSACTEAAEEVYGKSHVLMITPASTKPDITGVYLTVLRVCGTNDQQGASAAKYVAEHFPAAKVAVVHDKSSYGQDLTSEFLKNYEFLTKTQAAYYGSVDRSQAVFTDVVSKIKALEPTLVYFGGVWPQGAELLKEIRQAGMTATFVSGDGCFDPTFIKTAGPAAEGTLMTFIPDQEKIPSARAVVAAYKKKYGDVGPYSLYAYTAATAALQGMAKAGSTEGTEVARALYRLEVDTPFGPMRFDEKGDPQQSPYVMWKVEGGKLVEAPMNAPPTPAPAAAPAPAK